MSEHHEYRLRIDAFCPDTLPMSRLAEYMAELARLLGEQDKVHFKKVEPGSAVLVTVVEASAAPKVDLRVRQVREGRGPAEALKAFRGLDDLLAKDNAIGTLTSADGAEIIPFPGRTRAKPISYGPFNERGSLDGVVVRVGSKGDDLVAVELKRGDTVFSCKAAVPLSEELAKHYRKGPIRVHGVGRWAREENRSWTMLRFEIESFEPLDDAPLREIIGRLHAVEGGAWDDPSLTDILGLRRDPEDQH